MSQLDTCGSRYHSGRHSRSASRGEEIVVKTASERGSAYLLDHALNVSVGNSEFSALLPQFRDFMMLKLECSVNSLALKFE